MSEHFADRLFAAMDEKRSQVVVGLDPRMGMMPEEILEGIQQNSAGASEAIVRFNEDVLDAVCDVAVAVKPQIAFYERFGVDGLSAYASTIRMARERGLIVIADVKRNDIGSTAGAYADAHLPGDNGDEWPVGDDFHADAITVNPLFGSDGVEPFVNRGKSGGSGLFVLAKTSNPSSAEIQDLACPDGPVYERISALIEEWGKDARGSCGYSCVGAVVGATFPAELEKLRELMPHTVFLVPGFGAQGGGVDDVLAAFDDDGRGAVVNSSRGIIYSFRRQPNTEGYGEGNWREAVRHAAETMREQIWKATHGAG